MHHPVELWLPLDVLRIRDHGLVHGGMVHALQAALHGHVGRRAFAVCYCDMSDEDPSLPFRWLLHGCTLPQSRPFSRRLFHAYTCRQRCVSDGGEEATASVGADTLGGGGRDGTMGWGVIIPVVPKPNPSFLLRSLLPLALGGSRRSGGRWRRSPPSSSAEATPRLRR